MKGALKAAWDRHRPDVLLWSVLLAAAAVFVTAAAWAISAGLSPGSFVLGAAVGVGGTFLLFRDMAREAMDRGEELRRLARERQRADATYTRLLARRVRLEIKQLRRELRGSDWRGDGE